MKRTPEKMRVGSAIRRRMAERGIGTMAELAELIGVTPTMVGFWRSARYLPSLEKASQLADVLDAPEILFLTRQAQVGICRVCLAPFQKVKGERRTRKTYCSIRCRNDYHKGVRAKDRHPAETAIAAFCQGCEPEGLCRTEDCALRAFSPFVFVARRVA